MIINSKKPCEVRQPSSGVVVCSTFSFVVDLGVGCGVLLMRRVVASCWLLAILYIVCVSCTCVCMYVCMHVCCDGCNGWMFWSRGGKSYTAPTLLLRITALVKACMSVWLYPNPCHARFIPNALLLPFAWLVIFPGDVKAGGPNTLAVIQTTMVATD